MTQRLRILAAAALASVSLAATSSAETITLEVSATPSIFTPMFEGIVDAFEASHPDIDIVLDASQRDQDEMIQSLLRRSLVGELPDVSFQGYNYLRTLANRGLVVPLDGFIAADDGWTADRYSHSVTAGSTVNGIVYGLGIGMSFPIIYYNRSLVAQVQEDTAALPDDWDDLIALAERISATGDNRIGLFFQHDASGAWTFQALVFSLAGRMMNEDESEMAFTGPEGLEALHLLHRIGAAGQADLDMGRSQARQAFIGGSVGMLIDSSSPLARLEEQVGDAFSIGTARLPIPHGDGTLPAAGISIVLLTEDPERQEAAWQFMRFAASPEAAAIVGTTTGYVPANEVSVREPELLGDFYADNANMGAALQSLPYADRWYVFPGPNAVRITDGLNARLQEVITLQATPEQALAAMAEETRPLLP